MSQLPAVFDAGSSGAVVLATRTLQAFTDAILKDGGNAYRQFLRDQLPKAEDAYRQNDSPLRTHLGASQIGNKCDRDIWYSFRWATNPKNKFEWHDEPHTGTPCLECRRRAADMVRLFNRGHLEEPRFVALLLSIGCKVYQQDNQGKQFKISLLDGHYGGSCDCVAVGIPDLGVDEPALVEMKTHKDSSFQKLLDKGVEKSKPIHFNQMQVYMGGFGLKVALYLAVNKDTEQIYGEIVRFNQAIYDKSFKRAQNLVYLNIPPSKINNSPAWYECKICDNRHVCHKTPDASGTIPVPMRNCRTCMYSKPTDGDRWFCGYHNEILSKDAQLAGCGKYTVIGGM